MYDVNNLTIIGRLTRDPESSIVGEDRALCKFSIANNPGKDENAVCYFDVTTWGKVAESCGQYLKKGSQCVIIGRIQQERWKDKETEKTRSKVTITANSVQFIGGKPQSENDSGFSASSEQPQQQQESEPVTFDKTKDDIPF